MRRSRLFSRAKRDRVRASCVSFGYRVRTDCRFCDRIENEIIGTARSLVAIPFQLRDRDRRCGGAPALRDVAVGERLPIHMMIGAGGA